MMSRYAMRTDEDLFSKETLNNYLNSIPEGIQITKMNEGLF